MAAPLAKGFIISLSLLLAAGVAIYEHPQVKQWVDESRRKVAIALHELGDEIGTSFGEQRPRRNDASTREDSSPEAVERRWQARQSILERGRILEERRRATQPTEARGTSFNDMVDETGTLKSASKATTTGVIAEDETGLKHRKMAAPQAATLGSFHANPFEDETLLHYNSDPSEDFSRQQDHVSPSHTPISPISPPVPPKPAAYQSQIHSPGDEEMSDRASDSFANLTPTTSALSMHSAAATDLLSLNQGNDPVSPMGSYWSVNEWAQNHSVPGPHSPPVSIPDEHRFGQAVSHVPSSMTASIEHASQVGTEDMDVMSEFDEAINTPSTWTEVGSQVGET